MTWAIIAVLWLAASLIVAALWAVHGLRTTRGQE